MAYGRRQAGQVADVRAETLGQRFLLCSASGPSSRLAQCFRLPVRLPVAIALSALGVKNLGRLQKVLPAQRSADPALAFPPYKSLMIG